MKAALKYTLFALGVYYFVTGMWSVVHLSSFIAATGYPADPFKTHANGVLFAALGLIYIFSALRKVTRPSIVVLAGVVALYISVITFAALPKIGYPLLFRIDAALELIAAILLIGLLTIVKTGPWHKKQ